LISYSDIISVIIFLFFIFYFLTVQKKYNMNRLKILFIGFMALVFVASCSKDESKTESNQVNNLETRNSDGDPLDCKELISNARIEFGRILFNAINNDAQLASYVKQKMISEFNTNYSFLYIKERDIIVHSGLTFEEILINHSGQTSIQGKTTLDDIVCKAPLLTISMSDQDNVSVNDWTTTLPSIAAIKECMDVRYVLFDNNSPNGLGLTTDPTIPTLNIIDSEIYYLVKSDGKTNRNTNIDDYMPKGSSVTTILNCSNFTNSISNNLVNSFSICGNSYKLFEHDEILQMYIDCFNLNTPPYVNGDGPGGEGVGPTGNPCTKPCARDCETLDETLVNFRIKNWQVYKAIANRFWETKFIFHGKIIGAINYSNGTASSHPGRYVSGVRKRGDLLNCSGVCTGIWQTANYRIWTDWDESNFGSPYWIDWSEEDNGTQTVGLALPFSTTFKVKIGGLEVATTYGFTASLSQTSASTVTLGIAPVFYCDPIMRINDTGSLQFKVN